MIAPTGQEDGLRLHFLLFHRPRPMTDTVRPGPFLVRGTLSAVAHPCHGLGLPILSEALSEPELLDMTLR